MDEYTCAANPKPFHDFYEFILVQYLVYTILNVGLEI